MQSMSCLYSAFFKLQQGEFLIFTSSVVCYGDNTHYERALPSICIWITYAQLSFTTLFVMSVVNI